MYDMGICKKRFLKLNQRRCVQNAGECKLEV